MLKPGVEVVLFGQASFPGHGDGIYVAGDDKPGLLLVGGQRLPAPVALPAQKP